eukprot:796690-Lingulodinium_polyedra.AAC.1
MKAILGVSRMPTARSRRYSFGSKVWTLTVTHRTTPRPGCAHAASCSCHREGGEALSSLILPSRTLSGSITPPAVGTGAAACPRAPCRSEPSTAPACLESAWE